MIDIKFVRENPEIVEKSIEKRGDNDKLKVLQDLLVLDETYRKIIQESDALRQKRNELSREIAVLKKSGKDAKKFLVEASKLPKKMEELEEERRSLEEKVNWNAMRIPNILHDSVPKGIDESDGKVIRKWGVPSKLKFEPKDHQDLAMNLELLDVERASKTSGARFYFLKNELVKMNYALLHYAIDFISKKGFHIVQPPFMINRRAYEGVVSFDDFEHTIYKIQNDDLHMIATSEHPLMSMWMDETIMEKDLPLKVAGVSPCFRKEAGSHGKDTKGIFRVHQFDKVEQTIVCTPEQSWKLHEELLKNMEQFWKSLEVPYRTVLLCSGDTGFVSAKTYDVECWFPAQNSYRELGSCSNVTDFQARRLGIKFRNKEGEPPVGFVHTLNATLVPTQRALACILENGQQKDGSIKIPKVLHKYTGFKTIGK